MSLGFKLIYHKEAIEFLSKQEKYVQDRIALGLKGLLQIPPRGDIKTMKGYNGLYRLRIGTFRILFEINHVEKLIYILTMDFPGGVYK
ncbi:type II toxin-antitoxin system RelE/ParE family toxin [Heliobacillus mobilis]|uniref:Type II toxin-antitoxin system RelE/ParE family toxin n=1 Tax=Heliobacterium mobile TaxID=28064 RepID=A0A6I3SMU7_HELMO|nr:type II toxin-antitoxin system RelE/ParE family toxin [Heliobacterium mobile]MTV50328.1 type II toxin-antitoxin system RelE/ParE family toxin [Heliobacterium mobile]